MGAWERNVRPRTDWQTGERVLSRTRTLSACINATHLQLQIS